jgi:hypothetical protein
MQQLIANHSVVIERTLHLPAELLERSSLLGKAAPCRQR